LRLSYPGCSLYFLFRLCRSYEGQTWQASDAAVRIGNLGSNREIGDPTQYVGIELNAQCVHGSRSAPKRCL